MSQFRNIQIDFDVNKMIETNRRNFDETPNDVLRRLLDFPSTPGNDGLKKDIDELIEEAKEARTNGAWMDQGVTLPAGTRLRMKYNGALFEGEVMDGRWVINGESFWSPSGAACRFARTKKGNPTNLNGWKLWWVLRPGDTKWSLIKDL